jgi:hypothetical protein
LDGEVFAFEGDVDEWCATNGVDGNEIFGSVGEVEWLWAEVANSGFATSKQSDFRDWEQAEVEDYVGVAVTECHVIRGGLHGRHTGEDFADHVGEDSGI